MKASDYCVGLKWNRALLTMPLISGAGVSVTAFEPQGDLFNIHCDRN